MGHAAGTLRAPDRLAPRPSRARRPWTALGLAFCAIAGAGVTTGAGRGDGQTLWDDPAFALYRQAVEAMDRKDFAGASDLAGQAVAQFPDHVLALYLRGQAEAAREHWAEAAAAFEKVVALYPGSFAARRDLGTAREHLGRVDDAARAFTEALAIQDREDLRVHLAFLLLGEGRQARAVAELRALADRGTRRPEVWTALARASYTAGDLPASEQAFARSAALRDDGRTWFNLGVVRLRRGDTAGALDAFEHAAQHDETRDQARQEITRLRQASAPRDATAPDRAPVDRLPGTGQGSAVPAGR